jgi:hypothetical protein
MRVRKQSALGADMQFGHSSADFWHNQPEAVGQSCYTRLLLFAGEWFLDVTEGTPWGGYPLNPAVVAQGQILAEHTALSRDAALRERVIGTPGVLQISAFASQFDPSTRVYSAQLVIDTVYGQLAMQLSLGSGPPLIKFAAVTP